MDFKLVAVFWILFREINGFQNIQVEFAGQWQSGLGWQLVCSWLFPEVDRLQSVRLYNGGQQFMIFRPEVQGYDFQVTYRKVEQYLNISCSAVAQSAGHCVINVLPLKVPTSDQMFTCEVSGERPWFRMERKDYELETFVEPSNAVLNINMQHSPPRMTLNCTSSGLPPPVLYWSVGDQKMVPPDFTGSKWDPKTKLVHVWSTLTSSPQQDQLKVICIPETKKNNHQVIRGLQAEYTLDTLNAYSGSAMAIVATKTIVLLMVLALLR